jgi:choline dehydrogenase
MVIGTAAGLSAIKILPAIGGAAVKIIPAIGAASSAIIGAGKLAATIGPAIKAATAIIGIGKLAIIPVLISALAYYNYDLFDPENRPFNVKQVDQEYDFIVVGGGAGGAVVANRLSEIGDWKVLLLEAGGHETEISDVPILSLFLHKSKLDWRYR